MFSHGGDGMKKDKSKKKYVALLDDEGVLTGYAEVDAIDPRLHAEVLRECDLEPKKYKWNDRAARFDPIGTKAPDAMLAIIAALTAIRDGKPLPAETLEWLAWWEQNKVKGA